MIPISFAVLVVLNISLLYRAYQMRSANQDFKAQIRQLRQRQMVEDTSHRIRYQGPDAVLPRRSLALVTVVPALSCMACLKTDVEHANRVHEQFPERTKVIVRGDTASLLRERGVSFHGEVVAVDHEVLNTEIESSNPYSFLVNAEGHVLWLHENNVRNPHNADNRAAFFRRARLLLQSVPSLKSPRTVHAGE